MCPLAHIGDVNRWLQDHDSDVVDEQPPVQNTWYEAFHAEDVRLIWCLILQNNDEAAAKDLEVRWTIDGNSYEDTISAANGTYYYVFRSFPVAGVGLDAGLAITTTNVNAGLYTDKRGLDFKVEVRITSALGTNQRLRCWCVRETREET